MTHRLLEFCVLWAIFTCKRGQVICFSLFSLGVVPFNCLVVFGCATHSNTTAVPQLVSHFLCHMETTLKEEQEKV